MTPDTEHGTQVSARPSDDAPISHQFRSNPLNMAACGFVVRCVVLVLFAAAIAATLVGCAGLDSTSFSGGGVPVGGSRLFGRVVSAASPSTNLANVSVSVKATPDGGITSNLVGTTASDGTFSFSNVLPGFSNGTVQLTATPSDPAFQSQSIAYSVSGGHTQQLVVTLPPASFDPTSAKSVTLTVASPAVPPGGSIQAQAVLRDSAGAPLGVMPSLVFDGNFGSLGADGVFSVPAGILSGVGTISAYWQGLTPQAQQIHVDPNASQQPPSPPVLPNGQH